MAVLADYFNNINNTNDFEALRISLASPEVISSWSFGEVKKPDTVNYRTIKPENGGLFCSRIFGPTKDYECLCGKYKRMKYRGIICEKCGVEVTTSKERRRRMAHIELAAPVVHIWFLRSLPSRISTLLDLPLKVIEKVLYFDSHIVAEPGLSDYKYGDLISEDEYDRAIDTYGEDSFVAGIGAEIIQRMLTSLDLLKLQEALRTELLTINSETKRKKTVRRLKLVEDFLESGNRPEWMVLTILPVIPPDLRPLVMLDGGRFATSDLNELYRRVINRNNRLRRLIELHAPDIIVRNEKRMLQEAVDALFDNGRRVRALRNANKRPFKSLADMLKGKQGRFRQNLLGKRVDYSGRSVIVVGPELMLHQCGLPKRMALELFKPFIYGRLEMLGLATTLKNAKRMVETERPEVWDVLDEVIKEHPVLLNRAPTLHRLGIQAFEPLLIEGKAIQLHPLVCSAFNADFDGDQMAVHVPLSIEAQLEARVLMMSTNNILRPADGKPIIVPSNDIVLGIYYMTMDVPKQKGDGMIFSGIPEIEHALNIKAISLHSKIKCLLEIMDKNGELVTKVVDSTPGRILLSTILPLNPKISFELINKTLNKKELSLLIERIYRYAGQKDTVIFADQLMQLGFKYCSISGVSMGKNDIIIPETKEKYVQATKDEVNGYESQYIEGLITAGEKYNKVVDAWSRCTDQISVEVMKSISADMVTNNHGNISPNSIFMMADSGARGSITQIKQLAGMRGLMTKPSGEIIEIPIISNFKEGLTVMEYFTSTHGTRKGLADTALKTANSGYLTRKLVDVAQDCIIMAEDCGTEKSLEVKAVIENGQTVVALADLILGRIAAQDIANPATHQVVIERNQLIDEEVLELIKGMDLESIDVRSPLMCENQNGICAKCYGRDLATGDMVDLGEAVGIVAAQSIGEPGTQLTMRTFQIGGAAQKSTVQSSISASHSGQIKFVNKNTVTDSKGRNIVMSRNFEVTIIDDSGSEKMRSKLQYGTRLLVSDSEKVRAGQLIAEWDPFTTQIITEKSGVISFVDLIKGISVRETHDEITGVVSYVVTENKQYGNKGAKSEYNNLQPRVVLHDTADGLAQTSNDNEIRYFLPVGAILNITDKAKVHAGDIIARIPKESLKSRDITGGLPRVVELFEARQPKDGSIISEIQGHVEFGKDYKSKRRVIVRSAIDSEKFVEYFVPRGRHVMVNDGDYVNVGDVIMEGDISPHEILRIVGVAELTNYIVREVQQVYRLQGITINDKHIEVIIRQMLRKVEITKAGSTTFLVGAQVDKDEFNKVNSKTIAMGHEPAESIPVLQGITRASLQTKSFLSAASFQETTRVLTESAIAGKIDVLFGLKENIITGRLIPAGTGFYHKQLKIKAYEREKEIEEKILQMQQELAANTEKENIQLNTIDFNAKLNSDNLI